jgi:small subunit ribosomal protein S6
LDGNTKKLYEAMFLADSGEAASDWDRLEQTIRKILSRNNAQEVSLKKWDERKLAYEIQGKGRGTYILCHFNADGDGVSGIEKDVQMSEQIMRVLILRVVPGMDRPDDGKQSAPESAEVAVDSAGQKAESEDKKDD